MRLGFNDSGRFGSSGVVVMVLLCVYEEMIIVMVVIFLVVLTVVIIIVGVIILGVSDGSYVGINSGGNYVVIGMMVVTVELWW